jgi:outer membrane lipoprotein-sorting protein
MMILSASPVYAVDGTELLKQVDRNLRPASYEMHRELINIEPDSTRKEYVLYTLKKDPDKMIVLFLDPPNEKGRAILRVGDSMWLHIPNVAKPLRITNVESAVGGVFNNSDILRLDYSVEYDVEKLEEQDDLYLLSLRAKTKTVAYDKLKMYVDKKSLMPVTVQAFAATGLLVKTLHYKNYKDFGDGLTRPSVVEADSPLFKSYKSVMQYSKINKRQFEDEVFTLNYLPRVDKLR